MRFAAVMMGFTLMAAPAAVPSAALAEPVAEVHVEPDAFGGTIVYTALPGRVNDVTILTAMPGVDRRPVTEAGGSLILGAGCQEAIEILCGQPNTDGIIRLGDRSDRAVHRSYNSDGTVYGGRGDDDISSDGLAANAYGGPGDDRLLVTSNGLSVGDGGSGNDRLEGVGPGVNLTGGPGDDHLSEEGGKPSTSTLDGGAGNDRLEGYDHRWGTGHLIGGPGRDVLVVLRYPAGGFTPRSYVMEGGNGRDLIGGGAGEDTLGGGPGDDAIQSAGGGRDRVTCGLGYDVAIADPEDLVAPDCESVTLVPTAA